MRDQNLPHSKISKRATCIYVALAGLFIVFANPMAWSQQPNLPSLKDSPYAHAATPHEVLSGSARLLQHYDPSSKLRVALGITPSKMAAEEKFLQQLQDKSSPNFHKYLTPEQWHPRFAPSAQDEQAVVDWATSQGLTVTARYPNRLMVNVEGTVATIEQAFRVTINKYDVNGQTEFSNAQDPVIPANLATIVGS